MPPATDRGERRAVPYRGMSRRVGGYRGQLRARPPPPPARNGRSYPAPRASWLRLELPGEDEEDEDEEEENEEQPGRGSVAAARLIHPGSATTAPGAARPAGRCGDRWEMESAPRR